MSGEMPVRVSVLLPVRNRECLSTKPLRFSTYGSATRRHFEGFSKTRLLVVHEGSEFRAVLPITGVMRPKIPPRPAIRDTRLSDDGVWSEYSVGGSRVC